jgi:hypothetical protein
MRQPDRAGPVGEQQPDAVPHAQQRRHDDGEEPDEEHDPCPLAVPPAQLGAEVEQAAVVLGEVLAEQDLRPTTSIATTKIPLMT